MGFNNKHKLILWVVVITFTLLACNRVASETPNNNSNAEAVIEDTATPNFFLTEVFATANAPTATQTKMPTATSIAVTVAPSATAIEEIVESPTPEAVLPTGKAFIREFDIVSLDFNLPEDLEGSHSRPGPRLGAVHLSVPPVIDGDLSDWDGTAYALGYLVLGAEFYSGDEDIYAVAMLGWDETNFYLGVQVTDNQFVQTAQGNDIYRGDSLELMLDTALSADYENDFLDEDDYQLGISPGNLLSELTLPEAYLWSPLELFGSLDNVLISSGLTDIGYSIEVAIPWESINVIPEVDTHLGFLLGVSDNDFVNQNSQQSVVSFAPDRNLNDPTSWYTLVLTSSDMEDAEE